MEPPSVFSQWLFIALLHVEETINVFCLWSTMYKVCHEDDTKLARSEDTCGLQLMEPTQSQSL